MTCATSCGLLTTGDLLDEIDTEVAICEELHRSAVCWTTLGAQLYRDGHVTNLHLHLPPDDLTVAWFVFRSESSFGKRCSAVAWERCGLVREDALCQTVGLEPWMMSRGSGAQVYLVK